MEKITQKAAIEIANNNYCKLIVKSISNQKKFDSFFTELKSNSKNNYNIENIDATEIVTEIDDKTLEENIKGNDTPLTIASFYVEETTFDNTIDKDKLKDIFSELYQEALYLQK